MGRMANGAKTEFITIPSRRWKDIYKAMDCERCLRTGVVKVQAKGVVIMCTKGARIGKKGAAAVCARGGKT